MRYGLQGPDGSVAECWLEFLCNLVVAQGILFPDNATQILAAVLEIGLDKDLELLLVWSVYI